MPLAMFEKTFHSCLHIKPELTKKTPKKTPTEEFKSRTTQTKDLDNDWQDKCICNVRSQNLLRHYIWLSLLFTLNLAKVSSNSLLHTDGMSSKKYKDRFYFLIWTFSKVVRLSCDSVCVFVSYLWVCLYIKWICSLLVHRLNLPLLQAAARHHGQQIYKQKPR